MFSCHWSSASGEKKSLFPRVTSKNHVIEGSSNFMVGSSSLYVKTLLDLVVIGIMVVGISCFYFVTWSRKNT